MSNLIPIPFIEVDPISGLPEKTSLEPGGHMLLEASDGNTYRIKTEVFYQLLHSIASPISPSDTGPFTSNSWYKPLEYSPDPGTNYPNAGDLKAIEKFDTLFYYNGTSWVKMANKLPGVTVAPEFDILNDEDAQAAKQINSWLVNDVEGGEAGGTASEEVGDLYKLIGSTSVGDLSQSLSAGTYDVFTNSTSVSDANKYLSKGSINLSSGGSFYFGIGKFDGSKFVVRWKSNLLTGVVGWNTYDFKVKINAGEQAVVICPVSTTASILLKNGGGDPANSYILMSTVGGIDQSAGGYFFSLNFQLNNIDIVTSTSEFSLAKSVAKIVNNFADNNYKGGVLSSEGDTTANAETSQTVGYAVNKYDHYEDCFVEKIEVRAQTAGSYTLVLGFVDQWNKLIEKKLITVNLIAGINTVTLNEVLEKNDVIGFKMPSKFPVNNTAGTEANLFVSSDYGSLLNAVPTSSLPIKLFLRDYTPSQIATKSDLNNVNASVNGLQQNFIHEGKRVGLTFNSDGTVEWAFIEGYSNILHLGNSIAKHPITSYWWGSWGMAASELSKDYVHRFLAKMQVIKPSANTNVLNIAEWEASPSGWNKSTLDPYLTGNDLICIRLGENATYNGTFKTEFAALITYIKTKNPTAKILIGGVFWADANKDTAMSQVAAENNLIFVPISQLDIPVNRSFIGAQVKGDDNQWYSVNNSGVAIHPGDLGMEAIASEMFNALGL